MNPQSYQQYAANAYNQGQQQQAQLNSQSQQLQGQYNQSYDQSNQAYQNLLNYTKSMQNPADAYSNYLTQAQSMYGFNPNDLKTSLQNVANTNTTLANLPQATQQQGNYYGTTAGSIANNYANQAGNLNGLLQGQTNNANVEQQMLGATQTQANQQAGLLQGFQQQQSGNYNNLSQNALSQMTSAGQTMSNIENLAQQQGGVTAQQVQDYLGAYQNYYAAQNQSAQAGLAGSQAQLNNQQYANTQALQQQLQSLYGANWAQAIQYIAKGQQPPSSLITGSNGGNLQGSIGIAPKNPVAQTLNVAPSVPNNTTLTVAR